MRGVARFRIDDKKQIPVIDSCGDSSWIKGRRCLVKKTDADDKFAILWNFSSDDDIMMRNICHESFHIAMSVCQFCNMSLGFKVGEDEHAAYIAGFAGDCVSEFINSKNTD